MSKAYKIYITPLHIYMHKGVKKSKIHLHFIGNKIFKSTFLLGLSLNIAEAPTLCVVAIFF